MPRHRLTLTMEFDVDPDNYEDSDPEAMRKVDEEQINEDPSLILFFMENNDSVIKVESA